MQLSSRMKARYPDEITIVLQHQFWDLTVNDRQFEVGLSFSNIPERLIVPFTALTGFHDPSVPFMLKFEPKDAAAAEEQSTAPTPLQRPSAKTESLKTSVRTARSRKGWVRKGAGGESPKSRRLLLEGNRPKSSPSTRSAKSPERWRRRQPSSRAQGQGPVRGGQEG